jgi:hypothetical protein
MEKARKRVNLAVKNIVLGVGRYVIKHNNMRAMDINLYRNDGTWYHKKVCQNMNSRTIVGL